MEREHLGEWLANAISHGIGLILALAGFIVLLTRTQTLGERVAITVYGLSLILLYLFSTLYHALPSHKARIYYLFKRFDHIAIYLLIAGTYTPFVWILVNATEGFVLLGLLWVLALVGIILKAIWIQKFKVLHVVIYLLMGWSIVFIWPSVSADLSSLSLRFLIGGGLAYSFGVIFYALSRVKLYMHFIWHLFVLAGSILHALAVYQILN